MEADSILMSGWGQNPDDQALNGASMLSFVGFIFFYFPQIPLSRDWASASQVRIIISGQRHSNLREDTVVKYSPEIR